MRWLITGANRGIGLELARQVAATGDEVIATARDPAAATELRATGARVERLEVRDAASTHALAQALATTPIDVLVNNAGKGGGGPGIAELDLAIVADLFAINALGPLRVVQALLPSLRAGTRRLVVQLSSNLGSIGDNRSGGMYGYRASKAALNMLNRSLALELAAEGFTCVVVHPGWVQTDMGGPRAPLALADAVRHLRTLFAGLGPEASGRFWSYTGDELGW